MLSVVNSCVLDLLIRMIGFLGNVMISWLVIEYVLKGRFFSFEIMFGVVIVVCVIMFLVIVCRLGVFWKISVLLIRLGFCERLVL